MIKIFIDLEFCPINRKTHKIERNISKSEVIQVGAVMLDEDNKIIGRFDKYVKPEYGILTNRVIGLTHITEDNLIGASKYAEVMNEFVKWIGDQETKIYSWSNSDKVQLLNESKLKEYNNPRMEELFNNWVDFQMEFGKILGATQPVSLSNALNGTGITFAGNEHSAVDDAENTARLYILTRNEEEFKKQAAALLDLMQPSPDVSVNLGSLFTEDMMQKLAL